MRDKIYTLLLVLYPITNIYGIGVQGMSLGKILLLISGFYILANERIASLRFPPRYFKFAVWMLLVPFLYILSSWTNVQSICYKSLGLIVFILLVGISIRIVKVDLALRYFRMTTLAVTSFFYIQYTFDKVLGLKILGIIPGLPLADSTSTDMYVSMQSKLTRYCSFFLEPSHFAVYISLFLAIKLMLLKGKVFERDVLFVFIALILLQSGNGYSCLIAIAIAYVISNKSYILCSMKRIIITITTILFLYIGYHYISQSDAFSDTFDRVEEVDSSGNQNSSGFTRIFRGFYFYSDLSPIEKVVGIGQGNEFDYAKAHRMHSFRMLDTYTDAVYLNGVQQILVYGGIIGGFLFIYFLSIYYKKKETVIMALPFTTLFFISGVYNGAMMMLYIVYLELIRCNFRKA